MTNVNTKRVRQLLQAFDFQELFVEELGWERQRGKHNVAVGDDIFEVAPFAEKKGVVAFMCQPLATASFPDSAMRKRIEKEVAALHFEHLIVFVDPDKTRQIWQVPKREGGKTKGHSEIPYFSGKGVEHLARRVEQISFTLGESENVSLLEVSTRVNQALLAEKVTKKFFKQFSEERKGFVKFLDWIEDEAKRDWYCSVLLNRLMFIYFLGGKGFLPGGTKFLAHSLAENTTANGADTFYSHFLLPLSFFGLGERQGQRGRFEETFKDVLYLDGGLFAVHQVERELGLNKQAVEEGVLPPSARIPDEQFQKWFAYFDAWRWTLDEDKVENDGYISPHILGYIFEKYINQKQMGAYYTKEDITGYICRNTIIPRLFDMLAECSESPLHSGGEGAGGEAFGHSKYRQSVSPLPIGPHPNLLNEGLGISNGEGIDRYIYQSVKQDDKLPTETDYEQAQRRNRYESILTDFDEGKIAGIDDFITYNLDIERLAIDFVGNIQDPEVLHAFYFRGLQQITVLDPTCGSGAFLFAALNLLYPLYNAALSRMQFIVGKATGTQPDVVNWDSRLHFDDLAADQGTLVDLVPTSVNSTVITALRAEVERINEQPSAEYFIKKSIIVNNLFGVDLMEEAVEICKLRLFLTLIATVERNEAKSNFGVDPLPDIDFNILAGNSLVGYSSLTQREQTRKAASSGTFDFDGEDKGLREELREYGSMLSSWRKRMLGHISVPEVKKSHLVAAAQRITPRLNNDLFKLYKHAGLLARVVGKKLDGSPRVADMNEAEFTRTHKPFHWLLSFPAVEAKSGFDAVVGNPPFVETSEVRANYKLLGYKTESCGNLFAHLFERALSLCSVAGRTCFILPISGVSTPRMEPLVDELRQSNRPIHLSHFAVRPGKLFDGVDMNLTIINAGSVAESTWHTTGYTRWASHVRSGLFNSLFYTLLAPRHVQAPVPKIGSIEELDLLNAFDGVDRLKRFLSPPDGDIVYVHSGGRYFRKCLEERLSNEYKPYLVPKPSKFQIIAYLSSSLFYWWWIVNSDTYHVTKADVEGAPISEAVLCDQELGELGHLLLQDLWRHAVRRQRTRKDGTVQTEINFHVGASRQLLDQVDQRLACLMGLSAGHQQVIHEFDTKFRFSDAEDE
ncbi:hypothetical protein MCEMSE15_01227 [Fimbriimonadaceae bacterium]